MKLVLVATLFTALASSAMAQSQAPLSKPPPQARQPASEQEWAAFVRGRLSRHAIRAVMKGIREGIVGKYDLKIVFVLQPDGSPGDVRVRESSGNKAVDEVGLRIPDLAAPFPAFSPDMPKSPKAIVAPFSLHFEPPKASEPIKKTAP